MSNQSVLNTKAIEALDERNVKRIRMLTLQERVELLIAACRAAAEIEASKLRMGLPATKPAAWPDSTRKFLAEAARRVREESSGR
jgi:hypothetical protein